MLRTGETKAAKEEFYAGKKKDFDVNNMFISKLIETKTNSNY